MSYEKVNWENEGDQNEKDLNAENLGHMDEGIYNLQNVELIAVTNTAPTTCATGDKYFNTTTNKIYTATAENTWGATGTDAVRGIFYIVVEETTTYYYNGTTLISVGGGSGGGSSSGSSSGWNVAGEIWTYLSVDDPTGVITVGGDKTNKYSVGMRIKFTNDSNIIYGIITAVSYKSPNTILTFLHEINPNTSTALYLMQNGEITNNYYSCVKAPVGFPLSPLKWTIATSSTNTSMANVNNYFIKTPYYLAVPVGDYNLSYIISLEAVGTGGIITLISSGLGTTNTPVTDSIDHKNSNNGYGSNNRCVGVLKGSTTINNTTKTNWYIVSSYANSNSNAGITCYSGNIPTQIKATCAYL